VLRRTLEPKLAPSIRVVNQIPCLGPPSKSLAQGFERELARDLLPHREADDSSREQVQDHGQIEPALLSPDVGDVRDPGEIRRCSRPSGLTPLATSPKLWRGSNRERMGASSHSRRWADFITATSGTQLDRLNGDR